MTEETEPNGTPAEANTIVGDAAVVEAIYSPPLSITTFFTGGNSFAGNMFDVANVSSSPLYINSFDIHLQTGGTGANISVYYTPNTYVGQESDSSQWTLMGTDTVDSAGDTVPTPVAIGGLVILPGESYGFYVTVSNYPAAAMAYTNGSNVISNADLSLTLGVGKGNPDFTGATFTPRTWNGTIYYYSPPASISVNKTVGTDPNECATGNDLTLPATGADVTYCYTVENTGGITLTNHNLVDDQLGMILSNSSFDLAPGASTFITATTQITQTVVNSATWTADNVTFTVSASDIATVTVPIANPSISVTKTVGLDPTTCATTDSITLSATGGEATYCFEVTNTGDITLTHHTVTDSHLGSIVSGLTYDLAPGASVFITATANVTQTTVNTATWTAFIAGSPVPISATADDTATVAVASLVTGVDLSADDAQTSNAGTTVTYTVYITNTGNVADTFSVSATGVWISTLSVNSITLNAGEMGSFTVTVFIPANAADNDSDITTITATSQTDGSATDSTSLTTTAEVPSPANPVIYLPMIMKP